jgi:hypothetical protein
VGGQKDGGVDGWGSEQMNRWMERMDSPLKSVWYEERGRDNQALGLLVGTLVAGEGSL